MSGSWYYMDIGSKDEKGVLVGVEKLANGLPNLKERLRDNDHVMAEVNKRIAEYRLAEAEATKKGEVI
jgi:hypothetical protein